jgi:hypothetical protein
MACGAKQMLAKAATRAARLRMWARILPFFKRWLVEMAQRPPQHLCSKRTAALARTSMRRARRLRKPRDSRRRKVL